jgi:hypothetical protein
MSNLKGISLRVVPVNWQSLLNKAQHGLFSNCTIMNVTSPPTMHMFDAPVRPILCDGFEVWGVDFGMQVRQYLEPGAGMYAYEVVCFIPVANSYY